MVSDSGVQLSRKEVESGIATEAAETSDLNPTLGLSSSGERIEWSPHFRLYSFPLTVGKTWDIEAEWKTPMRKGSFKLKAEVGR